MICEEFFSVHVAADTVGVPTNISDKLSSQTNWRDIIPASICGRCSECGNVESLTGSSQRESRPGWRPYHKMEGARYGTSRSVITVVCVRRDDG